MHFLYPAFLFALTSLAIPVVVHLFNFRRYKKVQFSNVQFLQELQEQQASRRNLRERLILAARLLALFFLVLAFAQPYLGDSATTTPGGQRIVSIFVDNSYSMQSPAREGVLLDYAKQKAKEIAAGYSVNDRFQLITNDFEGTHQRLLDRTEFNNAVDTVRVTSQSRTLAQVVSRQSALLKNEPAQQTLFVISDMQYNLFDGADKGKLTQGDKIHFIRLQAAGLSNIAVDSVWLLNAVYRPGDKIQLAVKLHNYSSRAAQNIPLKLLINGAQKSIASFSIKPSESITDTLSFSGLSAGWQHGQVELQDNPVNFDNIFYFTFNVAAGMPVLLIDNGEENPYLKAAFAADNFFKPERNQAGNVNYSAVQRYPLIVMSDVKSISAGLASQLANCVKNGQTLAVFPATEIDANSYRSLLQPLGLPVPGAVRKENLRVASVNLQSEVLKNIFESTPNNPDLPKVSAYYDLKGGNTNGEQILSLPGGTPFLSLYRAGKGNIYLSAVPLDDSFSTLQHHGLFVPLMYRMALLSGRAMPLFYTLGQSGSIEIPPFPVNEKMPLILHHGKEAIIPDLRQYNGRTTLYLSDQLKSDGVYTLKRADSTVAIMAFNSSRRESDLRYLTLKEIREKVKDKDASVTDGITPVSKTINVVNNGTHLWKLCIILALIFLAVEIALIRFF